MKKKFDGYTINARVMQKPRRRDDGFYVATVELSGDIEIGLEIDVMTWRADWLTDFVWKKEIHKPELVNVHNEIYYHNIQGEEINVVTGVWRSRQAWK